MQGVDGSTRRDSSSDNRFWQISCPFCHPINSIKSLTATITKWHQMTPKARKVVSFHWLSRVLGSVSMEHNNKPRQQTVQWKLYYSPAFHAVVEATWKFTTNISTDFENALCINAFSMLSSYPSNDMKVTTTVLMEPVNNCKDTNSN